MNKTIKYILIVVILGAIIGGFVYKYAMQPVADTADIKAAVATTFNELNSQMTNNDTAKLNSYTNKVISVDGIIKEVQNEDTLITVIVGDTVNTNTVICQTDKRHLGDFKTLKPLQNIKIKGVCAGFASDDLGLGSSIQLKNCVIDK